MPINHGRAKRPHEALLQLDIESRYDLRRIDGTLRSSDFGSDGAAVEIPSLLYFASNL